MIFKINNIVKYSALVLLISISIDQNRHNDALKEILLSSLKIDSDRHGQYLQWLKDLKTEGGEFKREADSILKLEGSIKESAGYSAEHYKAIGQFLDKLVVHYGKHESVYSLFRKCVERIAQNIDSPRDNYKIVVNKILSQNKDLRTVEILVLNDFGNIDGVQIYVDNILMDSINYTSKKMKEGEVHALIKNVVTGEYKKVYETD